MSIDGENYVEMKHGAKYELLVKNNHDFDCRFKLNIDGNAQGM